MNEMTMRERMLAIVNNEPVDRMPFVSYQDNGAPNDEVWQHVGRNHMGIFRGTYIHKTINEDCKKVSENFHINDKSGIRNSIITPKGILVEEHIKQEALNTYAKTKHFVNDRNDLEILYYYLQTSNCIKHEDYYFTNLKEVGDDGIVTACVERTPYQQMWILYVSLIELSYFSIDEEDLLNSCYQQIARLLSQQFEIMAECVRKLPIPLVEFPENLTAPCIGNEKFEKMCMPYYIKLKEMIGDTMLGIHADGDIKNLSKLIGKSGIDFLESYSPPPDNDMPLNEAVEVWPNMAYFINFPSSVHLRPPEEVYEVARQIIHECKGKKFWIQSSESVPPGIWKSSYPALIKAIEEN